MTRIKTALFAASLLSAAFATTAMAGQAYSDTYRSAALDRDVKFTVYLPDAYKDATTKLPAIYLLHGAGGDENEWMRKGGAVETLDGLIKRGLIRPSVVIM
ncbi:MAG: esterase, partial [Herminiimonas sp.]|nr:esterase [Herminiimonas sp.]